MMVRQNDVHFVNDNVNWLSNIPHNKHCMDSMFSNLVFF